MKPTQTTQTIKEKSKELDQLEESDLLGLYNEIVNKLNKRFNDTLTEKDEELLTIIKMCSFRTNQYNEAKNTVQKAQNLLNNIIKA